MSTRPSSEVWVQNFAVIIHWVSNDFLILASELESSLWVLVYSYGINRLLRSKSSKTLASHCKGKLLTRGQFMKALTPTFFYWRENVNKCTTPDDHWGQLKQRRRLWDQGMVLGDVRRERNSIFELNWIDSNCWRGSNKYSGQLTLSIYLTLNLFLV